MTSDEKHPQSETTETERNREQQEESGATDEGAGEGAEEILEDPSRNPDDPNIERYRGG